MGKLCIKRLNLISLHSFTLLNLSLHERMDILTQMGLGELVPYSMRLPTDSLRDLNRRLDEQQPKPQLSYIGLIAMAILSSREKKMILSEVYQWITDNYPYFRSRGPGWRNSIRHNLSLNDCFIKAGRSANGKGHYWAIHPANIEDFQKGDFRRRRAQRKVRRHMGLSVNEDECSDDSPIASPVPPRKSFSVESILQRDSTQRWLLPVIPPAVPTPFPFHLFSPHY